MEREERHSPAVACIQRCSALAQLPKLFASHSIALRNVSQIAELHFFLLHTLFLQSIGTWARSESAFREPCERNARVIVLRDISVVGEKELRVRSARIGQQKGDG
jgi:hypothetical protein